MRSIVLIALFITASALAQDTVLNNVSIIGGSGVESDPIFSAWVETGSVTAVESDPVFTNWLDDTFPATLLAATSLLTSNLTSEASARIEADAAITGRIDVVETTALTSVRCSGGWYNPDWFTLAMRPYPYTVISEGETNAVYSVYVSSVVVDTAAGQLLEPSILRMSTFTGAVEYAALSNCTIATVTVTNYLWGEEQVTDYDAVIFDEDLEAGTVAEITATLNSFARSTSLTYAVSNLYTYNQYQGDVPGSLRAYINTSLQARASVSNRTMNLYEDGWPTTWTRNTNLWCAGVDLTCASPYNSFGNPAEKGGVAITRQHIAFAAHYPITNGASLLFVDGTNGLYWRAMTDSRTIPGTDCRIGLLASALPATITPAQLMQASDNGRFLGALNMDGGIGIRSIHLKAVESNDPKTFAKWACSARITEADTTGGMMGRDIAAIGRTADSPYSAAVIVGDSGQPTFVVIGTNTVLYSTFHSSGGGPNIGVLAPQIETAIAAMGNTIYTNLNYINLDSWRDYNMPPVMGGE